MAVIVCMVVLVSASERERVSYLEFRAPAAQQQTLKCPSTSHFDTEKMTRLAAWINGDINVLHYLLTTKGRPYLTDKIFQKLRIVKQGGA
jgi:hypothetical protein